MHVKWMVARKDLPSIPAYTNTMLFTRTINRTHVPYVIRPTDKRLHLLYINVLPMEICLELLWQKVGWFSIIQSMQYITKSWCSETALRLNSLNAVSLEKNLLKRSSLYIGDFSLLLDFKK